MVPDTKCGTETQEALHLPVTGPTRTLAARIYASTAAFLVSRVINVATSLLLVPLYLSHWSQGYYGEWLALSSLVTYFTLFDFGLNMAATNRLTQSYARGEFESYARYQHSALAFYVSAAT